jgi:hypothetical protein
MASDTAILLKHLSQQFVIEVFAKVFDVDIGEQLGLLSELLLALLARNKLANKYFLSVQQHPVHFLNGLCGGFFRLKVDKSIPFRRSSFILGYLKEIITDDKAKRIFH